MAKAVSTGASVLATIAERLADPFDPEEVKWKPQVTRGDKAMAIAYIDARLVMERLDAVLGVGGWQDDFALLNGDSVQCRLSIRIENEWITKVDVGSVSEQPDEGDQMKAAFSDALKRAAVKFGVGRYLYGLAPDWVSYDPQKKKLLQVPALPNWALPAAKRTPMNGRELKTRLLAEDLNLASEKKIASGDLLKAIVEAGKKAGLSEEIEKWGEQGIKVAIAEAKRFKSSLSSASAKAS